jgi:type VI protein secretion system component Hcp
VTLTNAFVGDVHQRASAAKSTWLDDVTLFYQKIDVVEDTHLFSDTTN